METKKRPSAINLAGAKVVVVKFYFTNPNLIPSGLRSIERPSEQELIEKRKKSMDVSNEAETRGYEAINNVKRTQVALLRTGLANNGFRLVDAHVFETRKPGKSPKHVVSLGFRRLDDGETAPEIPEEAKSGLRTLATAEVWYCHGWWNPNGVMVIDNVQGTSNVSPLHALVVRNGWIVAEPTTHLLGEQEEDRRIAEDLLSELASIGM